MTASRLGALTVGEAPRTDLAPILESYLPPGVAQVHLGLLDGLDDAAVARRFGARDGERRVVTRRADGRHVELSAARVEAALPAALRRLEDEGCDVVLLLCTGAFGGLACERAWLVQPSRVVPPVVAALAGDHQVGVVLPLRSQAPHEGGRWRALERPPLFDAASPYEADLSDLLRAGRDLRARGARLLCLDCVGFVEWHRARLAAEVALPVLLSNAIVAAVTAELFRG